MLNLNGRGGLHIPDTIGGLVTNYHHHHDQTIPIDGRGKLICRNPSSNVYEHNI